jgi:hypothetical protein
MFSEIEIARHTLLYCRLLDCFISKHRYKGQMREATKMKTACTWLLEPWPIVRERGPGVNVVNAYTMSHSP